MQELLVYMSIPIHGRVDYIEHALTVADTLRVAIQAVVHDRVVRIVNPTIINPEWQCLEHEAARALYMTRDLAMLRECDYIYYAAPGSTCTSAIDGHVYRGMLEEKEKATEWGIPTLRLYELFKDAI